MSAPRYYARDGRCCFWDRSAYGYCDSSECTPCRRPATQVITVNLPPAEFDVCDDHATLFATMQPQVFHGSRPLASA